MILLLSERMGKSVEPTAVVALHFLDVGFFGNLLVVGFCIK